MMKLNRSLFERFLRSISAMAILAATLVGFARAEVLVSTSGNYKVGIDANGSLYDAGAGVGFQRVSDGYDPIKTGSPREAWGVAAGANSGYVDPNGSGISNIVLTATAAGFRTTQLVDAALTPILQIDQLFFFPYPAPFDNYLQINVQITNLSNADQHVLFSRNVNWNIAPSPSNETNTASALTGITTDGSFGKSENPDPLIPFTSSAGAAGGTFGPGDLGAGLLMDLGTLKDSSFPGDQRAKHFSLFYGVSRLGQTEAQMRAELLFTGGANRVNAAILGVGGGLGENVHQPSVLYSGAAAVPEPTGVALLGIGALSVLGLVASRRARELVLCRA